MEITVFANQKGGVGKTTILVHTAFYLSEIKMKKVVAVDLDHQGNASFTLSDFSVDNSAFDIIESGKTSPLNETNDDRRLFLMPASPDLLKFENDSELVDKLKKIMAGLEHCGVENVLIDTTPALNNRLASALMISTTVVTPIELEVYSIQGVKTIDNIKRNSNDGMKFLGMLPSRVDGRNPRHRDHLNQLKENYPDLIIPHIISSRSSVAEAVSSKIPVWKIKKTSARPASKEMKAFGEYLFQNTNAGE